MIPDLLVIGGGAAGLLAALDAAPLRVLVVAKAPRAGDSSSSSLAQGGVAAALEVGDTPEAHARDTMIAGAGLCDAAMVASLTEAAPAMVRRLIDMGGVFDRRPDGSLALGREGAHSARRILHAGGDSTGREIMRTLTARAGRAAHIEPLFDWVAEDLIVRDGRVVGAWVREPGGKLHAITARAVMLATGGTGQLFARTTNPSTATGDGVAMAARAGAELADLEFVQFHPTAMDVGGDPLPLATEALRGEGATLVDAQGVAFMAACHADADLAPRDVVARAIWRQRAGGRPVFLDASRAVGDRLPDAFPTVFAHCRAAGIDPRRQPIPVVPAAHYHMGGVAVDPQGRTSLDGLWAGGEVACSGAHGANRLASNGILEALVLGERVAADLHGRALPAAPLADGFTAPPKHGIDPAAEAAVRRRLRDIAYEQVGVVRDAAGLSAAVAALSRLERENAGASAALRNGLLAAAMMAAAALVREESRGSHFRSDFPEAIEAGATRQTTTLADLRRVMEAVPEERQDRRPA